MHQTTLPNLLTIIRIALIPVVVVLFYFDRPLSNWIVASIFVVACITDYLDGYFARALKQTTTFGIFLDPVADKLLVAATLLMLVGFGRWQSILKVTDVSLDLRMFKEMCLSQRQKTGCHLKHFGKVHSIKRRMKIM